VKGVVALVVLARVANLAPLFWYGDVR